MRLDRALALTASMPARGLRADAYTYCALFSCCAEAGAADAAAELYAEVRPP